jgi:hypothetical protein
VAVVNERAGSAKDRLREQLDYRYREIVEESGIAPDVATERGYRLERTKKGLERLGFTRKQQQVPAIVIPRFAPSGEGIPPQIKPDNPRQVESRGKAKAVKYDYPPRTPVRLSVHPRAVKVMRDRCYPLWISEGDKTGDALISRKAVAVVLQGVGCWDVPQDWEDIKLHGREVIIAFDADVMVNPNVQGELEKLSSFLRGRGAKVRYLRWPEQYRGTRTGVDDYLAAGDGTVKDLFRMTEDTPDEDAIPVGRWMSDIEPERVEWLWDQRIPRGKITILDGDPDRGKSMILYDLAARVTTGKSLPDGQPLDKAGALIVSMEDGAADTIVPRFTASGGDPTKAKIIGSEQPLVIPDDLDRLERAIRQTGARFVAIDPIMSFLADRVDMRSDQQVRRALQPLADIAQRTGAAIVLCRHLNKSGGGETIYRGQGSIGFIGIVRSGLMVGKHPDQEDVFVLAGAKSNLSKKPESLAYRITGVVTPCDIPTARVEYLGRTEITANQMNAAPDDEGERDRRTEAKSFLLDLLRAGPVPTTQVKKEAKEADIAWRTVERAKAELKVDSYKDGGSGRWNWILPEPPEDGDEPPRSSPRRSDDGGVGGHDLSAPTPPGLADLAETANTATTATENGAYLSEHRQLRQLPATSDEPATSPTPPKNSANGGEHGRRLTNQEAEEAEVF